MRGVAKTVGKAVQDGGCGGGCGGGGCGGGCGWGVVLGAGGGGCVRGEHGLVTVLMGAVDVKWDCGRMLKRTVEWWMSAMGRRQLRKDVLAAAHEHTHGHKSQPSD